MSSTPTSTPSRPAATPAAGPTRAAEPLGTVVAASARATASPGVRTPWGRMPTTAADEAVRDPFEPDAPLPPTFVFGSRAAAGGRGGDVAPLSPRELYEMLMTPAAHPMRTSPARDATAAGPTGEDAGRHPPAAADLIRSAIAAGRAAAAEGSPSRPDRRRTARRPYRARATLRLFSDAPDAPARPLYTVDAHARGLGFVTEYRLPLGYGGTVEVPDPAGNPDPLRLACTLIRCREAAPGWFEGSLCFNREQPAFDAV